MKSNKINVLAIDGGGIRGIIPAMMLTEIEKRTGKPISKLFDLIGGTSTGGILALGVSIPDGNGNPKYPAKFSIELYTKKGKEVFSRSIWHAIKVVNNFFGPKYEATGIETILQNYFGDTQLSESLTELLIPSYDLVNRSPYFFKGKNRS